jgi:hypothetical protein
MRPALARLLGDWVAEEGSRAGLVRTSSVAVGGILIHHKQTPIDMEGLPGDVGAGVRGQKNHGPGEVLRYLDPAERDVFLELEKERTMVGMHRGVHGAQSDRVHANVFRSYVLSRRPR